MLEGGPVRLISRAGVDASGTKKNEQSHEGHDTFYLYTPTENVCLAGEPLSVLATVVMPTALSTPNHARGTASR